MLPFLGGTGGRFSCLLNIGLQYNNGGEVVMYRRNILTIGIIIMFLLLAGCDYDTFPTGGIITDPATTLSSSACNYGVPPIDTFSSNKYEPYKYQFSSVDKAVLKLNGAEHPISADDPRLIRLLNAIAYSMSEMSDQLLHHYIEGEELQQCLSIDAPMLEITFRNDGTGSGLKDVPCIIVCEGSYLKFIADEDKPTGVTAPLAEMRFPFAEIVAKAIYEQQAELSISEEWGAKSFIDLIEYAGFIIGE